MLIAENELDLQEMLDTGNKGKQVNRYVPE